MHGKPVLRLPEPNHFKPHGITGNNATLLAKRWLSAASSFPTPAR